jgi:hypothetical protein
MVCTNCGTENPEAGQFCSSCGTFLDSDPVDRRVADPGSRIELEVWRVWAPRLDDVEGQLRFHKERAVLLQSLVETIGLRVTDWGDTFHEVPREKVWVKAEAASRTAVRDCIEQLSAWVRDGDLKEVFITVAHGAPTAVSAIDADSWLAISLENGTALASDRQTRAGGEGVGGQGVELQVDSEPERGAAPSAPVGAPRTGRHGADAVVGDDGSDRAAQPVARQPHLPAEPPREAAPSAATPWSGGSFLYRALASAARIAGRTIGSRPVDRGRVTGNDGPVDRDIGPDADVTAGSPKASSEGPRRGLRAKPPDRDREPDHVAYGLLRAPTEVVAEIAFELEVGLSKDPAAGVAGPPIILPPLAVEPYVVNVRIAAAGFDFATPETQLFELKVSERKPYPIRTIRLIAKPPPPEAVSVDRTITAEYSIGGERLADAIRSIHVLKGSEQRTRPAAERVETGVNVIAPAGTETADLTITVRRSDREGVVTWTFISPHTDVVPPMSDELKKELPDPDDFLRNAILQVDGAEGRGGVFNDVLALANRVAQTIPDTVWQAIRAVATKRGAAPTILIVSEEPRVPWELAKVDPPLIDGTDLPPFLAAQARVGRWVQATAVVDGRTRPSPNPPRKKEVTTVGVVSGNYSKTTWADLAHARKEATALVKRYGAQRIGATNKEMYELLKGVPAADLLHFAVHGRYNPQNPGQESGIILTDGNSLHANEIAARDLASAPVVFLNACQVGAGQLELGAYSGVAAAFVEAGASAVIAPLWKIDDGIAMDIALAFYKLAAEGQPLSEVLRAARKPFVDSYDTKSATWMAYQLFGHPSFVVGGLPIKED